MGHKLLFQHAARLYIEASINGFVRHAPRLVCRMRSLQPPCDLLRRPVLFKLPNHSLPQLAAPNGAPDAAGSQAIFGFTGVNALNGGLAIDILGGVCGAGVIHRPRDQPP